MTVIQPKAFARRDLDPNAKLKALAGRSSGWKHGRGVPPSKNMVLRARTFIALFRLLNVSEIDVFASEDGEAMVTAYLGDFYMEANLELDDTVTVVEEVNQQTSDEIRFSGDLSAFQWIRQRIDSEQMSREQNLCDLSVFSLWKTSTYGAVNSTIMPSKIQETGRGYQFFVARALNAPAVHCARTLAPSILDKQVTQRSSGNSRQTYFQTRSRQNKVLRTQETTATSLCLA